MFTLLGEARRAGCQPWAGAEPRGAGKGSGGRALVALPSSPGTLPAQPARHSPFSCCFGLRGSLRDERSLQKGLLPNHKLQIFFALLAEEKAGGAPGIIRSV